MCYTDISDETWQRLEPVLPLEGSPKGGRPAKDKRTFINAIIWLLRTGAPSVRVRGDTGSAQGAGGEREVDGVREADTQGDVR